MDPIKPTGQHPIDSSGGNQDESEALPAHLIVDEDETLEGYDFNSAQAREFNKGWGIHQTIAEEMNSQDLIVGEARYEQPQRAVVGEILESDDENDFLRSSPPAGFDYVSKDDINQDNLAEIGASASDILVHQESRTENVMEQFMRQESREQKEETIRKSLYGMSDADPFKTPEKKLIETKQEQKELFEQSNRQTGFESFKSESLTKQSLNASDLLNFDSSSSSPQMGNINTLNTGKTEPSGHSQGFRDDDDGVLGDVAEPVVASLRRDDKHIATATANIAQTSVPANQDATKNISSLQRMQEVSPPNLDYQINTTASQEKRPLVEHKEEKKAKEFGVKESVKEPTVSKSMASKAESSSTSTTSSCPFSCGAIWFNPDQLHPLVAELIYWRDPKKSGVVFGSGLVILFSLIYFSIISVVAYTSLIALSVTLSFRIYKNILQAVQKTNEGHPFKEYLEVPITPSPERVHQVVDIILGHVNATVNKLRSVFLVEDIIDSLKFVILFWCLTYIGSWFNGLTLVILGYLAFFSLPKVYEMHKAQIDQHLHVICTQVHDVVSTVRAKIPFPAKKEKDQ